MKFERYGIGIAKGLTVTIRHLLRHPTVNQFPEQRLNISRRTRGNELIWSREKCTGCGTCAKTCPQGVIEIVTSTNLTDNKYEVEKYQVDTGYCIQCGLCVEACPYEARVLELGGPYAEVLETVCQGCGVCVAVCPNGASQQVGYALSRVYDMLDVATTG